MKAHELSDVRALQDAFAEYDSLRVAILGEVTCLEERMDQEGWETAPRDEFEPTRLKLERDVELRDEMAEIVARMAERRGVPLDEVRRAAASPAAERRWIAC